MKKLIAAIAALAAASGAGHAQQELVSNPRGLVSNFAISDVGAILTEMGAVWQQRQTPEGQPYIIANVGGELVLNIIPTACLGQNYTNCVGMNAIALFSGAGLNYQTVSAFNQKYAFTTAGISQDGSSAYLSRYDIADYGIPRGNIAASLLNFVALADKFRGELATAGRTVSLEGYADDMSSRLLNSRSLAMIAGEQAIEGATRHDIAFEKTSELVDTLLSDRDTPRNKIKNITAKD